MCPDPRRSKLGSTSIFAAIVSPIARVQKQQIGAITSVHTPNPASAMPSETAAPISAEPRLTLAWM